ncbi:MAG: 4Fe-4S binding protein, partial [Bacteroides sp.]|nr:4Fe-4S binding protein [Bacteroides sp.]
KRDVSLHIDGNRCDGCEKCVVRCRRNVLDVLTINDLKYIIIKNENNCVGCGKCLSVCYRGAIEITENRA